jgi:deazaflavin-dependent oxidoreductase (nitroreductase family)
VDRDPARQRPQPVTEARFCSVTTTGRITGNPHEIEIWYVQRHETVYILMGGGEKADTVRNVAKNAGAWVRIGSKTVPAHGRVVSDAAEAAWVREHLPRKYAHEEEGLAEWAETALPVAFDLDVS